MDILPLELWTETCSRLDKTSLRAVRCVNSAFAAIGARYLFEGVVITLIPEYLHKLAEISFSPSLRINVKTIYLDASLLSSKFIKFEAWTAEVDIREPYDRWCQKAAQEDAADYDDLPRLPEKAADSDYHWSQYLRLHRAQKHLIDHYLDGPMLTAALALLPNLASIEPVEDLFPQTSCALSVHDFIMGNESDWLPALSCIQKATLLERPYVDPQDSTSPDAARPLASIVIALAMARSHIHTFKYITVPWVFWRAEGPLSYWPGVRSQVDVAFRGLRSLTLTLFVGSIGVNAPNGPNPLHQITSFVQAAPQLRCLDLTFEPDRVHASEPPGDGRIRICDHWCSRTMRDFSGMFARLTLPHIEELRMSLFAVGRKSFVGWMERHSRTLRVLKLETVYIIDPFDGMKEGNSWEKAVKRIAPIMSSLEQVDLQLIQDQEIDALLREDRDTRTRIYHHQAFSKGVSDYMMHKGQMGYPRYHQPLVTIMPCNDALLMK